MTETKVHHQTERGARTALAKKQISQESYEAILAGTLTLATARELGREGAPRGPHESWRFEGASGRPPEGRERPQEGTGAPPQPISRISKDDTTQECWCGCGERTKPNRRWLQGHDQRGKGIISRAVAAGRTGELPDQLRDYGQERGLI